MLVGNIKENDFKKNNLTNINSITLNTKAVNDNQLITNAYVDQFHQENEQSRRDLAIDFCNESSDLVKNKQENDFNDKKLTNIDSVTGNGNPTSDNEVANKNYVDNSIGDGNVLRFNETLENYLSLEH